MSQAPEPRGLDLLSALRASVQRHAKFTLGKRPAEIGPEDHLSALSLAVRDHLIERMHETLDRYDASDCKRLYYLSMEFLIGRSLANNMLNLGLLADCEEATREACFELEEIRALERDAALGNGGLGRLAACFLDSLATLDMPGIGHGINYEYGLFRQEISDGAQVEKPDNWLTLGTPWEIPRPDRAVFVPLYGHVEHATDAEGGYNPMWLDWQLVIGVPHDMPIAGYGGRTVNFLRLFSARSSSEFDMGIFNEGDYFRAVQQKMTSETISKVLYPSDSVESGRELRLIQEYFLVRCSLKTALRKFESRHDDMRRLPQKVAIQLNDTHPALAVAELMRALVDEEAVPWDTAWDITRQTLAYTNHTLLPEALETWSVPLLGKVLPRHLQLIYEINRRFLDQVDVRWPGDEDRRRRMSLVEEGEPKKVRMANLAIVGSHSVNGVARLHSELIKTRLVPDFHEMWPERFNSKTNGVTPRRWIALANPGLGELLNVTIGDSWVADLDGIRALEPFARDPEFVESFLAVKRANKERLGRLIEERCRLRADPDSMFDVQIKRIHEYKRQLLLLMHVVHLYLRVVENGEALTTRRTVVIAGKAAPGYRVAKEIIRAIHRVGDVVNSDPAIGGALRLVFLPDYRVSLAEKIIPAADLSEQISTAGMEASGTGNMKLSMNGALTMGTLDGANIEIREAVGPENFYLFGLTAEQVDRARESESHDPKRAMVEDDRVSRVMDALLSGHFARNGDDPAAWIARRVLERQDRYFLLADLPDYIERQEEAARDFRDRQAWAAKAILNIARMGGFSSDRTIREYARDVWHLEPVIG